MRQIPHPDAIFGTQGITQEDKDYQGSRFSDLKATIFANPYQKVWAHPNEPPLPYYKTKRVSAESARQSGCYINISTGQFCNSASLPI
jgi:hypothetical protein